MEVEKTRIGGRFAGCVPRRKVAGGRAEAHLRSEVRGRPRRASRYTDYPLVGIPRRMSRNTETGVAVYRGDRVGILRSAWRYTEDGYPQVRCSPLFVVPVNQRSTDELKVFHKAIAHGLVKLWYNRRQDMEIWWNDESD